MLIWTFTFWASKNIQMSNSHLKNSGLIWSQFETSSMIWESKSIGSMPSCASAQYSSQRKTVKTSKVLRSILWLAHITRKTLQICTRIDCSAAKQSRWWMCKTHRERSLGLEKATFPILRQPSQRKLRVSTYLGRSSNGRTLLVKASGKCRS